MFIKVLFCSKIWPWKDIIQQIYLEQIFIGEFIASELINNFKVGKEPGNSS